MTGFSRRDLLISSIAVAAFASSPAKADPVTTLDLSKTNPTSLDHFWSRCVGAGRANEGLRASWLEQLALAHRACGFKYVRMHGLFHDDMFVMHLADGKPVYNWQYVDDLFDRLLAMGVKPFVELGFMPKDLASTSNTTFWWKANTSPPKDYGLWGDLVGRFAQHCIDRWGAEEVRTWYFEVWNEPDLHGFWDGTRTQYFELYRTSALAIKAVDHSLRVGGPATSNFVGDARFDGETEDKSAEKTYAVPDINLLPWHAVWVEAFLTWCAQNKLPVDFVSCHPYPTDFALNPGTGKTAGRTRSIDATRDDLTWIHDAVRRSAYPKAEIHLTEWSSSPSSRDMTHDYLQAAAFIIKTNLDSEGLVNSLSYWTFTDVFEEAGAGARPFHGGFGLINYQGIVKPSFHGYRMLNALGDAVLLKKPGLIVTRDTATGKHTLLAYNFPDEVRESLSFGNEAQAEAMLHRGTARDIRAVLSGLRSATRFTAETLDQDHGNAIASWHAMGAPSSLSIAQTDALKRSADNLKTGQLQADASGTLALDFSLPAWACMLISET